MNQNELDKLISSATGADENAIKSASKQADVQNLIDKLNPQDASKLQQILADPKTTQKVLATSKAQAIMNKLFGKK